MSLKAGAKRLGVKIVVLQKQIDGSWAEPIIMGKSRKKEYPIIIGFSEAEKHYVLLVPKRGADSIPQAWRTGSSQDGVSLSQESLRGSGKRGCLSETPRWNKTLKWLPQGTPASSSALSVADSRVSSKKLVGKKGWLPSRTPVSSRDDSPARKSVGSKSGCDLAVVGGMNVDKTPSSKVRKRPHDDTSEIASVKVAKKWLPHATPKSASMFVGSTKAATRASSVSKKGNADSLSAASSSHKGKKGDLRVWTCGLCQTRVEGPWTGRSLAGKRYNHLSSRHAGEDWSHAGTLAKRITVVVASPSLPEGMRAWSCGLCKAGLPVFEGKGACCLGQGEGD